MSNHHHTERGNVALSSGDGAQSLWVIEDGKVIMEILFHPDNYPAWSIDTNFGCPVEKLAEAINRDYQGWYVRKMNIDGVRQNGQMVAWEEDDE